MNPITANFSTPAPANLLTEGQSFPVEKRMERVSALLSQEETRKRPREGCLENLSTKKVCLASRHESIGGETEGCQKIVYSNRTVYVGGYKEGKRSGFGSFYSSAEKLIYQGQFENNLPHGKGTRFFANGSAYTGAFKEGKQHGLGYL